MGCPSLGIISLGLTEGNIMLDFICIYNSIHKFSLKLFHFLKKVAKKKISTKYPVQRNKIPALKVVRIIPYTPLKIVNHIH